jgi:hypothetical protein
VIDFVRDQLASLWTQAQALDTRLAAGGSLPPLPLARLAVDLDGMRERLERHAEALDAAEGR